MERSEHEHLKIAERQDVELDAPSHIAGVHEGNRTGQIRKRSGLRFWRWFARATARRSTGIATKDREPIHPDSPNLPPA